MAQLWRHVEVPLSGKLEGSPDKLNELSRLTDAIGGGERGAQQL